MYKFFQSLLVRPHVHVFKLWDVSELYINTPDVREDYCITNCQMITAKLPAAADDVCNGPYTPQCLMKG